MNKPVIAVIAHTEDKNGGKFDAVRASYIRTIHRFGGVPILLPPIPDARLAAVNLDLVSGLLVPGGSDVSPELYGEVHRPDKEWIEPDLDVIEMALIREAWQRNMPTLAICRGIQSLAVALGGALYRDLPEDLPELAHEVREHGRDHLAHEMRLDPDSDLAHVLGRHKVLVNSLHHQAVRDLPRELKAVGWSTDGVIEAVEAPSKTFFLALQCHPEELWEGAEPDFGRLFESFTDMALAYGRKRSGSD